MHLTDGEANGIFSIISPFREGHYVWFLSAGDGVSRQKEPTVD